MRRSKYQYILSETDTKQLRDVVRKGKSSASSILHANIILAGDCASEVRDIKEISKLYRTSAVTVYKVISKFKKDGLAPLLSRKKRETPPVEPKITGDVEAKIIALACTDAPEGCAKWTLSLLADHSVKLGYIDSISRSSVHKVLKKTR